MEATPWVPAPCTPRDSRSPPSILLPAWLGPTPLTDFQSGGQGQATPGLSGSPCVRQRWPGRLPGVMEGSGSQVWGGHRPERFEAKTCLHPWQVPGPLRGCSGSSHGLGRALGQSHRDPGGPGMGVWAAIAGPVLVGEAHAMGASQAETSQSLSPPTQGCPCPTPPFTAFSQFWLRTPPSPTLHLLPAQGRLCGEGGCCP